VLIGIGLIAVAAASPAVAERYSGGNVHLASLHYFYRQLLWIAVSLPVMIVISMMSRERARRLSLIGAVVCMVALVFVPIIGPEVNGAKRWIGVGFAQVQPSEFLKPFFVVALAWLLSLRETDKTLPVFLLSGVLTGCVAILLMRQPDFGSTIIFGSVWVAMLALGGVKLRTLGILTAGGLFGMGPGGGTRKFGLPEPHTDYIFSVIGEEFGLIACLAIALLYCAIVARVLVKLLDEENMFCILAGAGLVIEFGLQALINMAVNVQLAPSKGMTLPFISYGGSSMLALSIGMGLLLAFTRRNPYLAGSAYVVKWSGDCLPD